MKVYQEKDLVLNADNKALLDKGQVASALILASMTLIKVAKDEQGNIRQVKLLVRDSNIIKKLFLANIDQSARTLTQVKTREIMTYFEEHPQERKATFEETFKANEQDKKVTFVVTYHGNGTKDHRNYSCEVVSSDIVNAYAFID